jgi:hypothetical protein
LILIAKLNRAAPIQEEMEQRSDSSFLENKSRFVREVHCLKNDFTSQ